MTYVCYIFSSGSFHVAVEGSNRNCHLFYNCKDYLINKVIVARVA